MKTKSDSPEGIVKSEAQIFAEELAAQAEILAPKVRGKLGGDRELALSMQPTCIAEGGFDVVLQRACMEAAGHPDPLRSATLRTIQLCGSQPKPEDLNA